MASTSANINIELGDIRPNNETDSENGKEPGYIKKTIFRFLTVMLYISTLTMPALLLSLYYIFFWNPGQHKH